MGDLIEFFVFVALLLLGVLLLGRYMFLIFRGERTFLHPIFDWLENLIYRSCGINQEEEMDWKTYAKGLLIFNLIGLIFLFLLQLFQGWLPLNPQGLSGLDLSLAFNTAVSFVTNTNWQAYGGENTMSYLTQMLGLAVQNFLSAATGNAVLLAFIRGISRESMNTIGNFWVDLTRTIVYLLLPLSIILSVVLVSQGVVQSFGSYVTAETMEGGPQVIPLGPAASQVAIKQLGTNGGGFFNANSAHPFENPTPLSNFLETISILILPAATVYMYGLLLGFKKQSRVIFIVMFILWFAGLGISNYFEHQNNPVLAVNPVWEGKEVRIGSPNSILWSVTTSATSNGSVNNMLSSLAPISGGIAMYNIMIGELIFGGVGVGLCGMLMFVLLTVFLAGLMVGRTPEYLGKKIEKTEIQWVMLSILMPCALILLGSGIAILSPSVLASLSNNGPHGLSELLYAYTSSAGNNGSAFAGLNSNTYFLNISLGIVMLLTRLSILIPSLAIAGSLVTKKKLAPSLGTFTTDSFMFGLLLISVILIVAALTFFPAFSLGPLVEQVLLQRGQSF